MQAYPSGRNDLLVSAQGSEYKISGSAFKEKKDRCFHHGTMLLHVDLGALANYLTPDSKKLQAKGIKSVKARVINLREISSEIDHETLCGALIDEFFEQYDSRCEIERLNRETLLGEESLNAYYEKLKSWEWVYGKTPSFAHRMQERFSWGGCELHLDTEGGLITQAVLYTDSLHPESFDAVPGMLKNMPTLPRV